MSLTESFIDLTTSRLSAEKREKATKKKMGRVEKDNKVLKRSDMFQFAKMLTCLLVV